MSLSTYGNVIPSDISPDDLDVFYTFSASRTQNSNNIFRLNATDVITQLSLPENEQISGEENVLEGMYNLTLPATTFNQIGIYTIYIRPKVRTTTIVDCGVLSAQPTVKGIIINANNIPSNLRDNNALQGHKIEYVSSDGTKLKNVVRYVVTSYRVIPVTENIGNTSQTTVRYKFDDSGSLIFLQLSPSSASKTKANARPFIGNPNQKILYSNTTANPIAMEIEFVDNDINTVIDIVAGEQIKDVERGILTHYNSNREIIKQVDLYKIQDDLGTRDLYEVKENRTVIQDTDFNTITDI